MAKDKAIAGTVAPNAGFKSTKCVLTRDEFAEVASTILIGLSSECFQGEKNTMAEPKNFSADKEGKSSFGWGVNDKITVMLSNGKSVKLQVGINLIVIGSKEV